MALILNGSANTLTGLATGGAGIAEAEVVAPAALGNHGVIQVVTAGTTTAVEINDTTWTDTGVTATITPRSNSNKILIMVRQSLSSHRNTTSAYMGLRLLRGATVINNTGNILFHYGLRADGNNDRWSRGAVPFTYIDSAATTSSVSYKTQYAGHSASDGPEYKVQDDSNDSNIVLMEVVA